MTNKWLGAVSSLHGTPPGAFIRWAVLLSRATTSLALLGCLHAVFLEDARFTKHWPRVFSSSFTTPTHVAKEFLRILVLHVVSCCTVGAAWAQRAQVKVAQCRYEEKKNIYTRAHKKRRTMELEHCDGSTTRAHRQRHFTCPSFA